MAMFKVGDRVRIVNHDAVDARHLIGCEGVLVRRAVARSDWDWIVFVPAVPDPFPIRPGDLPEHHYGCMSYDLVPLTPPAADTWAESKVREVTKPVYTEPERVKEKTHG